MKMKRSMNNDEIAERRQKMVTIYYRLLGQRIVTSQSEFGRYINLQQSNVSKALKGDKRYLTDTIFNRIYEKFGDVLGEEELTTNRLNSETTSPDIEQADNIHAVRYWSESSATGGGVELYDDTQTAEHSDLLVPGFADCTDAVNLFGDSMSPLFNSGEIIILRPWTENWIDYGQIYLVITTNGYRMVKYLQPGNDDEHVICESANTTYKPFEIPKSDILKMYLVKGSICRRTL